MEYFKGHRVIGTGTSVHSFGSMNLSLYFQYRPLIFQMTDSLLYSKVYFVELTLNTTTG